MYTQHPYSTGGYTKCAYTIHILAVNISLSSHNGNPESQAHAEPRAESKYLKITHINNFLETVKVRAIGSSFYIIVLRRLIDQLPFVLYPQRPAIVIYQIKPPTLGQKMVGVHTANVP